MSYVYWKIFVNTIPFQIELNTVFDKTSNALLSILSIYGFVNSFQALT